ncbi:MAG: DUF4910 domain-containing protein [Methylocystaceae bacterium]|nr:DUF4910 domain-containing protein [Methylocystaceae bacterium]
MKPYQETEAFFSDLFDDLFPLLRSITGPGLRESYRILGQYMPFEKMRVNSGEKVFDWTVPEEWRCSEAYLEGPDGTRVVDMAVSNLHVLNYSAPVDETLSLEDLQAHLYSNPDLPTAVPYVASYYSRKWGFCLSHQQREQLDPGMYRAVIKSEFIQGGVDLVQSQLSGQSDKEILLSSYMCHPSLANNELSGPLVLLGLYHRIKSWKSRRHNFRFVLHPETIGSLCFLHLHHEELRKNLVGGAVLNMMGGKQTSLMFKHSVLENGVIDKAVTHLSKLGHDVRTMGFDPNSGADERQYASPGFQFPVLNVSRDFYPGYEGYHSSLDTKEYMDIKQIMRSIDELEQVLKAADECVKYQNLAPYGEPQLGPRGLYETFSYVDPDLSDQENRQKRFEEMCRIKMLLTYCDGKNDAIDIAEKYNCSVLDMSQTIETLEHHDLLQMIKL